MNKQYINVLLGPPGSGKTTYALGAIRDNANLVRISKDELRVLFKGSRANAVEGLVDSAYDMLIERSIAKGYSVILDSTNCDYKVFKKKLKAYTEIAEVNLVFMDDLHFHELVKRNNERPIQERLAEATIRSFSDKYRSLLTKREELEEMCEVGVPEPEIVYNANIPDCVIIDLDDTVATAVNRGPYEWSKVETDAPIKEMVGLINALDPTIVRVFLTGRSDDCIVGTEAWLNKYFHFEQQHMDYAPVLLMRGGLDFRTSSKTKAELYEKNVKNKYNVLAVIDDDISAVQMYRLKGLNTLLCKNKNKIWK